MLDIEFVRGEIARLRLQVLLQRREIAQLQRAGIASPRPRRFSSGCSTRSTTFATSVTGSSSPKR
jgi:hypothetical protein